MPTLTTLSERLNRYSIASKSFATARPSTWELYAAALGAAVALTTGADASIIHQNVGTTITVAHSTGSHTAATTFNIGSGAFKAKLHYYFSTFFGNRNSYARLLGVGTAQVLGTGGKAAKFSSGAVISTVAAQMSNAHLRSNGANGNFPASGSGLAGVSFNGHPGWVRLQLASSGGYVSSLTVVDWAYENAGNTIAAGAVGSAVPEPGTGSLALLALGAAGVLALRRRKREEPAENAVE